VTLPVLVLAEGRERSIERRHPWIFSGGVRELRGSASSGETVSVCSSKGKRVAIAAFNPDSKITARVWSFEPNAVIDEAFFRARLASSVQLRGGLVTPEVAAQACRLVHGESDGLPGVVVDRYGNPLVLALTSAGAARHRDVIAAVLADVSGCGNVFERSDADVMALEGLTPSSAVLLGVHGEQRGTRVFFVPLQTLELGDGLGGAGLSFKSPSIGGDAGAVASYTVFLADDAAKSALRAQLLAALTALRG